MTGYGQPSDREKALDAGFFEHVTKPFEFERLAELIEAGEGDDGARQRPSLADPGRAARRTTPGARPRPSDIARGGEAQAAVASSCSNTSSCSSVSRMPRSMPEAIAPSSTSFDG